MDKNVFFSSIKLKSEKYTFPNDHVIELRELTPGEKDSVWPFFKNSDEPHRAQAEVVARGTSYFGVDDVQKLLGMPSDLLKEMSDTILRLSGIGGDDDPKKE